MPAAGACDEPTAFAPTSTSAGSGGFNAVIGTQTFDPAYRLTRKPRLMETAEAIRGMGGASRLTRNQLLTLQYTFNDVVASLSTGMSPMTMVFRVKDPAFLAQVKPGDQIKMRVERIDGALTIVALQLVP